MTITIPSASATGGINSYAEGADWVFASGAAFQPAETRQTNYTQIFVKTWRVSGTIEAVDKFGRGGEWAFRKLNALLGWKIDVEDALLNNSASAAGSSGNARTMDGLRSFNGLSASANASSSLLSPIDQGNLNVLLQLMWDQGVDPNKLICTPFVKRQIAGFAGIGAGRPIIINNGEREFVDVLDVYDKWTFKRNPYAGNSLWN